MTYTYIINSKKVNIKHNCGKVVIGWFVGKPIKAYCIVLILVLKTLSAWHCHKQLHLKMRQLSPLLPNQGAQAPQSRALITNQRSIAFSQFVPACQSAWTMKVDQLLPADEGIISHSCGCCSHLLQPHSSKPSVDNNRSIWLSINANGIHLSIKLATMLG